MTDKEVIPGNPISPKPADNRFDRVERIVRWAFWIAVAGAIAWVFVDLLIQH